MPKQDHSRDLLPHLDSKISSIRQQCYQLRAEREFLQVRIHDLAREVDALVRHYASRGQREGSDTSGSPSPGYARRNSASLHNLDCLTEPDVATRPYSRSCVSVDDTIIRPGYPGGKDPGPPSCPHLTRSLHSSPLARGYRKRVTPLDEVQRVRSSSHLKPDTSRDRSDSQQSLPDAFSKETPSSRSSMVRARSGDVRSAKMSLSSSSPALACKDSPAHGALLGQKESERVESVVGLLTSKTCTDL